MNENIRKCCDGAGLDSNWKPGFDSIYGQQLEKFAQLIVVECMDVFGRDLPEPGDGRMVEVIDRICNVAEHFGVE